MTTGTSATIDTIASLRLFSGAISAPYTFDVQGYYSVGDQGGGVFVYNPADTSSSDNFGTIIVDNFTPPRRWCRIYDGLPDPRWFGLRINNSSVGAANLTAIAATLAIGQGIQFPPGAHYISGAPIQITGSGLTVIGAGKGQSNIVQQSDNTQCMVLNGTRIKVSDLQLSWSNAQPSANSGAAGIKILASTSGGILGTSDISNIYVANCAIGIDLKGSTGYQTSFRGISVAGFSISAVQCDTSTGWTQLELDVYSQNQPNQTLTGTAVSGTTTSIVLPSTASSVDNFYKGMPLTITSGSGSGSVVHHITSYVGSTRTAQFLPATSPPVDSTSAFSIQQTVASSDYPFNLQGITDLKLKCALESMQLATNAPIFIQTVRKALIEMMRTERVAYTVNNSALLIASGVSDVTVLESANETSPILSELGVSTFFLARTTTQGTVRYVTSPQFNSMTVDSAVKWALASGARTSPPYGGVYFDTIPQTDGSIVFSGFQQDNPGPANQTAILGRPPSSARGVVLDAGDADYASNFMTGPDYIRFNTPITANRTVALDSLNLVAAQPITVIRDSGATGAFSIMVSISGSVRATLPSVNSRTTLYCDGTTYRAIP